ncbi:MAG: hypothetical protein ACI9MB_001220, partial [Verrucomicrobiales bacterium]
FDGVIFIMTPQAERICNNGSEKGTSNRLFFGNGIHCFA